MSSVLRREKKEKFNLQGYTDLNRLYSAVKSESASRETERAEEKESEEK
jgi:hypothetical protein